jgi:hypothetical protein
MQSATVTWTAPANGGSPITSYTVTPFIGSTAQPSVTVNGTPPATSTTVPSLTAGTAYTFTVSATNSVGTGSPSAPSNSVTPTAPTPPGQPTSVSAAAGNAQATVVWTAPSNGGSTITSYTVTPYVGAVAQATTTVMGSPPPATATVVGLTNGTSYTFTVTAANSAGTGPTSSPSNAVTPTASVPPAFVQAASTRAHSTSVAVATTSNVTVGDRIVVEVAIWNASSATASSVTDSAGNTYTELLHFTAADHTEMSVWTAPITKGGGAKLTVTAKPTSSADVGLAVVEYSGLSTVSDATVVDQKAQSTGTTAGAATVASGASPATATGNELAVGFYADSGFGDSLTPGSGWTQRANVSPTGDMEFLVEDAVVGQGATPNATIGTGASTPWLTAVVVFKHA